MIFGQPFVLRHKISHLQRNAVDEVAQFFVPLLQRWESGLQQVELLTCLQYLLAYGRNLHSHLLKPLLKLLHLLLERLQNCHEVRMDKLLHQRLVFLRDTVGPHETGRLRGAPGGLHQIDRLDGLVRHHCRGA
eukprot:Skav232569  [mRNA]  locus=scaffold1594:111877:118983:- [translate_table: standard]